MQTRQHLTAYAFEELVAEMGAAFLCGHCGINAELQHAGYIAHWLEALRHDKRLVFTAASMAQKAADFVLSPFSGVPQRAAWALSRVASFSAAAFVLSWTITSYSLIRLRKKEPNLERPYKIPGGIAMGAFSAIVTTVVFVLLFIPNNPVYMGKTASIMFVGWMVIGIILFLASGVQRRRISPEERAAAMFSHAKDA